MTVIFKAPAGRGSSVANREAFRAALTDLPVPGILDCTGPGWKPCEPTLRKEAARARVGISVRRHADGYYLFRIR